MPTEVSPPGVSVPALDRFLRDVVPGLLTGPLRVELLSGGRSNLTYLVTDGAGRWVLRRPPLGHVLATAHDMTREFRVLRALHPSNVPVPEPIVAAGPEVLGAPFYLMAFTEGEVLRERDQLASVDGARLANALVEVLVRLHHTDPEAVGLGDLGRPAGFLERQLRRWARQLADSHSRDLPGLTSLGSLLAQRIPEGGATIVHGDYRLDNIVVDAGRVAGVLDWEMATLGDPLTDLASMVVWWDGMNGLDNPVAAAPGETPGFPSGDVLVAEYAQRSGADLSALSWYLGFAYYKIAAIFEGIHYRAGQGLTVGDGFERLGGLVPVLVERGHAVLAR
jgi:aminoglycoside phosphotransferase (APT) family kinase protein